MAIGAAAARHIRASKDRMRLAPPSVAQPSTRASPAAARGRRPRGGLKGQRRGGRRERRHGVLRELRRASLPGNL